MVRNRPVVKYTLSEAIIQAIERLASLRKEPKSRVVEKALARGLSDLERDVKILSKSARRGEEEVIQERPANLSDAFMRAVIMDGIDLKAGKGGKTRYLWEEV